jgi:hypothetical protein
MNILQQEREKFEDAFINSRFVVYDKDVDDEIVSIDLILNWLTAHDHRLLSALKEAIEGKKYGKHNSDCEHDINWCVTHGEELMDCDFEQYGHNVGIDEALKTINSIEAPQSPESSPTDV